MRSRRQTPLELEPVIAYFGDSVRALAQAIRRSPQAVYQWRSRVPRLAAYDIEAATKGRFPAKSLNPEAREPCP